MRLNGLAIAALLVLCGIPAALPAQERPLSIAIGLGITQSDALSGPAAHLRIAVPLARVGQRLSIHAEALAQQGTISGPPSTCEAVQERDCTGRSDRNQLIGAGSYLRLDLGKGEGRMRAYLTPVGIGLFHRRTETEEQQAPVRTCTAGGQLVLCPDAAPFERFSSEVNRTSLGLSLGGGVEVRTGGVRLFADARVHRLVEGRGSWAGAAPLSLGISF